MENARQMELKTQTLKCVKQTKNKLIAQGSHGQSEEEHINANYREKRWPEWVLNIQEAYKFSVLIRA